MSESRKVQSMEMVIATTSAKRAQWMKEHYVGHTMSGKGLERRPMVQLTDAADFLDTAMRVYRITNIRLAPAKDPALTEVIAEYERASLWCEVCRKEVYPNWFAPVHIEEYHCFCPGCEEALKQKITQEIQEVRCSIGDPVAACVEVLLQQKQPVLPHRLARLLTGKELYEVGRRVWAKARKDFLAVLVQRLESAGMTNLDAVAFASRVPPPHWEQGEASLEYRQGETLLGSLVRQEQDAPRSQREKGHWHCVVLIPHPWTPQGRMYLETCRRLEEAKQVIESFWCRQEQREAERRQIRDQGGYSFLGSRYCGYAFCLERDPEWYLRQHLEKTSRARSEHALMAEHSVAAPQDKEGSYR